MATRASTATLTAPALAAYDLREAAAIRAFVERHPEVLDALAEAPARIAAIFGEVGRLQLELFVSEEGDHAGQLFILIPTTLAVSAASDSLSELDGGWYSALAADTRSHLCLDLEFA